MATKLILIRHGQTDWNLQKRYSGFMDIGLNRNGQRQARRLHRRLREEKVHRVYSSDRTRALQTARIVFRGVRIQEIPDLKEIHFGIFEGLTFDESIKKYPSLYKKWLADPFSITIPKAEKLADFRKRVTKALRKIICRHQNKTVAVVTHGGPISIFINNVLKAKNFWQHIPNPASINIIEYENQRMRVRIFNDTTHL